MGFLRLRVRDLTLRELPALLRAAKFIFIEEHHFEARDSVTVRNELDIALCRGHAVFQNLRRGHYELGVDARLERRRVAAAFDELTSAI